MQSRNVEAGTEAETAEDCGLLALIYSATFLIQPRTTYITQASLKLAIPLSQPTEQWNYK